MSAVRINSNTRREITAFIDAVEAFAADLPPSVHRQFQRNGDYFEFITDAPSSAHRRMSLVGDHHELEYSLGKIWTESISPARADLGQLLAALDAVRDGRVKEVREERTGLIYHLYRLDSRGHRGWMRDSQYSLWHWLRLKIRRVTVHTLPPLAMGEA